MADHIVSVRMPSTLVEELKKLAKENHYLDVSEEVRSLLREKWLEQKQPVKSRLSAARENIAKAQIPEKIEALKKALKLLEEINELQ